MYIVPVIVPPVIFASVQFCTADSFSDAIVPPVISNTPNSSFFIAMKLSCSIVPPAIINLFAVFELFPPFLISDEPLLFAVLL